MIDIHPPDLRGERLQQVIDAAAAARSGNVNSSRVTFTLQRGRYMLELPITLYQQHSNLTLPGSPEATILSAAPGSEKAFDQGLIALASADNATITGLELELSQVSTALPGICASRQQAKTFAAAVDAIATNRHVSISNRPVHWTTLTINDCVSRFSFGTTPGAPWAPAAVFGVGIFAAADFGGLHLLTVRGRTFPLPERHATAGTSNTVL
jgi:hypothetical protein